jgi:endonuclease YncB( thermonuclease family)
MELLLVLIILVVGAYFAFRPSESEVLKHPSDTKSPEETKPNLGQFNNVKPVQTNRFDDKSAEILESPLVITGRAYVTDGDTIKIKNTQIRLFGIDAPELNHPYGRIAKSALIKLCMGSDIRAEITETDHYGRTVAQCYLPDGRNLSAEMVKKGLAIDWPKFSGGKFRNLETTDARKKLFLADARQKGRMHVWDKFEARELQRSASP